MERLSRKSDVLYATIASMNQSQINSFHQIVNLKPTLGGESEKRDSLRTLKLICCWICNVFEIYTIIEEATLEYSGSEESSYFCGTSTASGGSLSTRQSSLRSHNINTGQKSTPARNLPTIVYEETKEPSDQNETLRNIPYIP